MGGRDICLTDAIVTVRVAARGRFEWNTQWPGQ
jgi:hypothetical protein